MKTESQITKKKVINLASWKLKMFVPQKSIKQGSLRNIVYRKDTCYETVFIGLAYMIEKPNHSYLSEENPVTVWNCMPQ